MLELTQADRLWITKPMSFGRMLCGVAQFESPIIGTGRSSMSWQCGARAYEQADYMQTEEFQDAIEALIHMSCEKRVAIMCAEAVPWRCHRSLVADALCVRGVPVVEILSESSYRMHTVTHFAQVEGVRITYPPEQATLL
jgi:Protein of unknown function, DUF488